MVFSSVSRIFLDNLIILKAHVRIFTCFLSTHTHVFGPDWLQQLFILKLFLLYTLMYFCWRALASLSAVLFMSTLIVPTAVGSWVGPDEFLLEASYNN